MAKTGLAWDVQRVTPEAMERKRAAEPAAVSYPRESPEETIREAQTIDVA